MVVSSASSSDAPSSDAAPLPATSQISMSTTEPSSAADGAGDADVAMSQTTTAAETWARATTTREKWHNTGITI